MSKLKIAMKRSEYEKARTEHWAGVYQGVPHLRNVNLWVATDLAAVEALGVEWEPEAPELPELVPVLNGEGPFSGYHMGRSPETHGTGGLFLYLSRPEADRVTRAWNARRPGGPMEQRLRDLVKEFCRPSISPKPLWAARCIEVALRLGVDEPVDEPADD